jgi:hypothetical protein
MNIGGISTLRVLAFGAAVSAAMLACSSESPSVRPVAISALALKASPAAYAMFQKELDAIKADNDFTKRAKDPGNYEVYITEADDEFLFTFIMRSKKGERILDGRSVYAVNKNDGSATLRSML